LFIGFALLLAGGLLIKKKPAIEEPAETERAQLPTADVVETDGITVFQRAFWGRPQEGDVIHHAERREWQDDERVTRWQWYLVVEPSAGLLVKLREENAFGLVQIEADEKVWKDAPDWFRADSSKLDWLGSPDGEMTLIFGENYLYATGGGGGFQQGSAPKTSLLRPQTEAEVGSGRLPNHSPPGKE
jgi:hypothetical protein